MALAAGTHFGTYQVIGLIGVGGMGEVYRATDTALGREVALKVLPDSFAADADRTARFEREAKTLASLNHTNIGQIYGLERRDGTTALVMELVEGLTLDDRLMQGPIPVDEALDIAMQIADALEAAHSLGIVHRDLKPANIKLRPDGTVKVLDFGIAKALNARANSGPQGTPLTTPAMTEAGIVLGTAAYMSPEQARGKPVDQRADIWAFACVLYEMLTGEPAFGAEDVTATLARVLERDPDMRKLPPGLAPTVRGTLELCLQKDPKKRLRDIGDVRLALRGELMGLSSAAARPLWGRALPIAAGVAIGAIVAGTYVASVVGPPEPVAQRKPAFPVTRFVVTPPSTAPLANTRGLDVMISPDGQRVVYFGRNPANGIDAVYVRELDALEARLVPGTDAVLGNSDPFFSPDGKSVGFLSSDRGVVRVALDGGPPMTILAAQSPVVVGGASWYSDDSLVFSSGRALHRASAGGGGAPERLTEEAPNALIASPVMLPGGRAVMFSRIENGIERVAVLDLDKNEQKIIVENGQTALYSDTGHVVFARGKTLMVAPFDLSKLSVTGEPVAAVENVRHPNAQTSADFALSASGTLIYVPSSGEAGVPTAVVWVDRAGNVQGRAITELVESPRDPALSPDGTRLAISTGPWNDADLWSYDLRGRPPVRLAVFGNDRGAVWSPDSTQVAFWVADSFPNLHTVIADGTVTPQPLRAVPIAAAPSVWSAAGELILTAVSNATPDISVIPVTGDGLPQNLVVTEYAEFDPALSPDGHWLAYASNRTGRNEVWVQSYPDGIAMRISSNGGFEPRWSPDGRELYYLQGIAVMAVAVQTVDEFSFAAPVQLFSGSYLMQPSSLLMSYDVARDGRFLMIEVPSGASEIAPSLGIVVVQNWTEELKRLVPTE